MRPRVPDGLLYMPDLTAKKKRPLWYNLSPLNLPVPGLVSIFHRVSGVALFLGLVAFLYLLDLSLASESGYAQAGGGLPTPIPEPPAVASGSAALRHMLPAVLHLVRDTDVGTSPHAPRRRRLAA